MINEIKKFKINLSGRKKPVTLSMDFKALTKMSKEYGNAFAIIGKFMGGDFSVASALIRCCADVELTEAEIEKGLALNYATMSLVSDIFNELVEGEIIGEPSEDEPEKNLEVQGK